MDQVLWGQTFGNEWKILREVEFITNEKHSECVCSQCMVRKAFEDEETAH